MKHLTPRALLADALVWDNHGCMPLKADDETFLPELARYRAAGVDAVTLTVGSGDHGVAEPARVIAHFRRWLALARGAPPERLGLADLAVESGYADQAHLTREVARLAGLPPAALLATFEP